MSTLRRPVRKPASTRSGGDARRLPLFAPTSLFWISGIVGAALLVVDVPAQAQSDTSTTAAATSAPASTAPPSSEPTPTSSPVTTVTTGPSTTPTTSPAPASTSGSTTSTTTTTNTTTPTTTTTTTTISTLPAGRVIPPGKVLKVGSKGADVFALEERLDELKIDTGKVDGRFDWSTWQGVVAFQKYWGLKRTGKVDNALRIEIQNSPRLSGYIFGGPPTRLEVDKSKQLLFMFRSGSLWKVISVSTGTGKKYCDYSNKAQRQVCGTATTPTGRFKIQRRISGWRESDLGRLYNPLYFNGGIAFHGAPSVPAYPASHGCVRLPMPIAEWFPDEVDNGTAVYVYD